MVVVAHSIWYALCWLVAGVEEASRVLECAEKEYPDSALFLYFKSRILRLQVSTFVINTVHTDCSESFVVDLFCWSFDSKLSTSFSTLMLLVGRQPLVLYLCVCWQCDTEGSLATCRRALAMSENQRETQHICLYEIGTCHSWVSVVFSERELTFSFAVCYRQSVCRLCLSVCLSVTFVRPTQAVEIFRSISAALGTLAIRWHPLKISRRSSQGNLSAGGVKHKRGSQV